MTKEEIKNLIDQKIAGQGSAVDVGGALPKILSEILDAAFAGANVQSDWDEADSTKPDFIKNKPTIPTDFPPTKDVSEIVLNDYITEAEARELQYIAGLTLSQPNGDYDYFYPRADYLSLNQTMMSNIEEQLSQSFNFEEMIVLACFAVMDVDASSSIDAYDMFAVCKFSDIDHPSIPWDYAVIGLAY